MQAPPSTVTVTVKKMRRPAALNAICSVQAYRFPPNFKIRAGNLNRPCKLLC